MNPLCIGSLPDFGRLFAFFFLWVVSTCVLICLVLLMDVFPSLIFIYTIFLPKFVCILFSPWGQYKAIKFSIEADLKIIQFMGMIPDTKRRNQNWWPFHFTARLKSFKSPISNKILVDLSQTEKRNPLRILLC